MFVQLSILHHCQWLSWLVQQSWINEIKLNELQWFSVWVISSHVERVLIWGYRSYYLTLPPPPEPIKSQPQCNFLFHSDYPSLFKTRLQIEHHSTFYNWTKHQLNSRLGAVAFQLSPLILSWVMAFSWILMYKGMLYLMLLYWLWSLISLYIASYQSQNWWYDKMLNYCWSIKECKQEYKAVSVPKCGASTFLSIEH